MAPRLGELTCLPGGCLRLDGGGVITEVAAAPAKGNRYATSATA